MELHGGTVEAASGGAGKGATFTVRLRAVPSPTLPAHLAPAATPPRVEGSVVLAEDSADAREMLCLLLRQAGHLVDEAQNGPDAVERIASAGPDVALVDVNLPGFDGYEVARRVRDGAGRAAPWLVALTGYAQAGDRQRALDAGFDEHLIKPVDPDHLVETVADFLARGPRTP